MRDRDTIERLAKLLLSGGGADDIDLPREVRGAQPAATNEVGEADVPRTTGGDGGLDTPWTFVRNVTRIEPVTDSAGDTFDEEVIEQVVLMTASGVEFVIPTGL